MDFKKEFYVSGALVHHSRNENPNADDFERHCHSDHELLYVVEGEGTYSVEGEELPLTDGSAMLLMPCQYHFVNIRADRPYERFAIHFNRNTLSGAIAELSLLSGEGRGERMYFPSLSCESDLKGTLDTFFKVAMGCAEGDGTVLSLSFGAALTQSLLLLSQESSRESDPLEQKQIAAILEYVNRNIVEDISLDEISREFFVSKYHLCRSFRRRMGVSLFEYVATKRYALAEVYLDGGIPATEVASLVGYRDYSSFYRAYVKRAGHPPVRMRKEKS